MMRSKMMKAFILGVCITAFSSTAAFAATGGVEAAVIREVRPASANELFAKQAEIDRYVFKEHVKEIESKGFVVTHTGAVGSLVEIGITPFSEESAAFLYDTFGTDKINVVEGLMAVTMDMGDSKTNETQLYPTGPDEEVRIYTTSAVVEPRSNASSADDETLMYATGAMDEPIMYATDAVGDSLVYATGVVEGAELYTTGAVEDAELYATGAVEDAELYATSATVNPIDHTMVTVAGIAGAIVLLGGAALVLRRQKAGTR